MRERAFVRAPIALTAEESRVLEPIKRRLLLGGAPGFVEDAEWYAPGPRDEDDGSESHGPAGGGYRRQYAGRPNIL